MFKQQFFLFVLFALFSFNTNAQGIFAGGSGKGDVSKTGSNITISSQPSTSTQTVAKNALPTNISINATSNSTITYQWYSNTTQSNIGGTALGSSNGANTNAYTPVTTSVGTTYYYCMLSANGFTTKSNVSGAVIVNCANLSVQPSTAAQYLGLNTSAVNLSVTASAGQAFTYQWYQNILPINAGGTIISSAGTSNTYAPLTNAVGSLYYYCVISVAGCSPGYASNVSGAVNVTYLQAFNGGSGKGDAKAIGTDMGGTFWLTTGTSSYATTSNWSNGAKPTTKPAFIPAGGTQPIISTQESIPLNGSLNVLSGASLTIAPSGRLVVNGSVINDGTITVKSDATGTASIGNSSGIISGNVNVERYIPSGTRRFRFLSSPVQSATLNGLLDDIFITGNGGNNGFDVTTSNSPSAFRYDETVITGNADQGWDPFISLSSPLTSGRGYRILIRGDRSDIGRLNGTVSSQNATTLDLSGTLNQGDVIPSFMTYSNSGVQANDGWNLMGNPYASNIDWNSMYDNNDFGNVNPTMYQRNAISGTYVDYNASSNAGTGSQYINSFGAFFLQFTGNPSGTFKESRKTANASGAYFKSKSNELLVKLEYDTSNFDLALVKFAEGTSSTYSNMEDSRKLMNESMNLFTISTDGIPLSTNLLSIEKNDSVFSLPLNISGPKANYKLIFDGISSFDNYKIALFDKYTNKKTLLTSNTITNISINDDLGSKNDRFNLIFTKAEVTGLIESKILFPEIQLYPNPSSNMINLKTSYRVNHDYNYQILNHLGQYVMAGQFNFSNNEIHTIEVSSLPCGIYFIKLLTNENSSLLRFIKQ
ncbi:MAG: T9SS type A sorting domain-containing protein [Bacteroidetes bacterium]|nr:T9SS type A sorting domain-containing protein [Bacteroidota bacterium]